MGSGGPEAKPYLVGGRASPAARRRGAPAVSRLRSGCLALGPLPAFEVGTDGLVLPAQLRSVVDREPGPTVGRGADAVGRIRPALPGELTDAAPMVLLRTVSHGASSRGAAPSAALACGYERERPGVHSRPRRTSPACRQGARIVQRQRRSARPGVACGWVSWPRGARGRGRPARGHRPPRRRAGPPGG